jgi:hypothetical protein
MTLQIYYACRCGFRTFFKSEADQHLSDYEEDHHPHSFESVVVDTSDDSHDVKSKEETI